jgi:hypothetical protein
MKNRIRGGTYGASAYGTYVWGMNQQADPNNGNIIKAEHQPPNLDGPGPVSGGSATPNPTEKMDMTNVNDQMISSYQKMMEPIPPNGKVDTVRVNGGVNRGVNRGIKREKSKRKRTKRRRVTKRKYT